MPIKVTREQVLAYRIATHGLHRKVDRTADLAVLELGVQDGPGEVAALALAARLPDPAAVQMHGLTSIWSYRGAPHRHRSQTLVAVAEALWPVSDEDAAQRMQAEVGRDGYRAVADAVRQVLIEPMSKGAVSAAVTRLVPEELTGWCRVCGVTHVSDPVLRLAGLPAGAAIEPGTSPPTLTPLPDWPGPPARTHGTAALIEAYLRLHGPAGPADAGSFLGMTQAIATRSWPAGLVEVTVDGKRRWLPSAQLDELRAAEPEPVVRLLARSDPYLQARDRALLVPDRARQKEIWRILGNPGAVLAGTEIVGVWRMKGAGRAGLAITVRLFEPMGRAARRQLDAEAQRVATVRGRPEATVEFAS